MTAAIEATDRILTRWEGAGMRFVTVPELVEPTGSDVEPAPA